jgi:16S rRNA (uracil1498-N3)-methyltransferase
LKVLRNRMPNYFVPHKLKVGDITNLSDKDSSFVISKKLFNIEDPVKIETLESIFWGIVTNIEKNSVEVEIVEKISDSFSQKTNFSITVIQSISNDFRFNFFLEKSVELGIKKIIPVESKYSCIKKNKAVKKFGMYKKTIRDAAEQSRNPHVVEILKPIYLKDLEEFGTKNKICLTTEMDGILTVDKVLEKKDLHSDWVLAIGPERGWSVSDLEIFTNLGFDFVRLGKNILRTETASLVLASILNFKAGIYS